MDFALIFTFGDIYGWIDCKWLWIGRLWDSHKTKDVFFFLYGSNVGDVYAHTICSDLHAGSVVVESSFHSTREILIGRNWIGESFLYQWPRKFGFGTTLNPWCIKNALCYRYPMQFAFSSCKWERSILRWGKFSLCFATHRVSYDRGSRNAIHI